MRYLPSYVLFTLALLFLISPSLALAQTPLNTLKEAEVRSEVIKRVENIQAKQASREARIEQRQEAKEKIETRREEIKAKQLERRVAFKDKLEAFKDQRKAQIAQRVDQKITQLNENRTTKMAEHLDKLSSVLAKLEERVTQAKLNGKDTTQAEAAIAIAKTSISSAGTSVTTQAGKDYGVTTTSETTVKNDIAQVRNTLNSDLKSTQEAIKNARLAVENALKVAAATLGGTNEQKQ